MAFISNVPKLWVVIPCYNEQDVLPHTIPTISAHLHTLLTNSKIAPESGILLVDDGSQDATWQQISALSQAHGMGVKGVKLSRNFGHQNALLAGMEYARHTLSADAIVSMDCDLQDDPAVLGEMLEAHLQGSDIVYGVRSSRSLDRFTKRFFAHWYYLVLQKLNIDIVPDHADYRLLSARAVDVLLSYQESSLFLRGLVPQLGFVSTKVYYPRLERAAGEGKYTVSRMLRLAVNGICGFTAAPLMWVLWLGLLVVCLSLVMAVWALLIKLSGGAVPGWASTVIPIYFLGSVQLLTLGVIGIYVGKIFDETKKRPRYIIEQEIK